MLYYVHNYDSVYSISAALKVMPPDLLWWPMLSKANAGGTKQRLNVPTNIPLCFDTMWWMAIEGQSDQMASHKEVHRCTPPCTKNCIHWHSLTLAECLWRKKEWMWAPWGVGWCICAVATEGHILCQRFIWAQHEGFGSQPVKCRGTMGITMKNRIL